MNTPFQNSQRQMAIPNWFPLMLIGTVGLAWFFSKNQPTGKFADADKRLKRLLKEEENQTRPFPKDVDLEPAFE